MILASQTSGLWNLPPLLYGAAILAVVMLVWNTIEVGRNDAANIVNAVFGSRVLTRQWAVRIAGIGVVLGATMGSQVVETARKGIFSPQAMVSFDDAFQRVLAIYLSVYIVNTILLYAYSSFGMPVSTTAVLVFALLGAAFSIAPMGVVKWANASRVVVAIICSIVFSGIASFIVQRAMRSAIRDKWRSLATLLLHGGWVGGGMLAGLCYFMFVKGMKNVSFVKQLHHKVIDTYGETVVILVLWVFFAILIHMMLVMFRRKAARLLFPILAIVGMLCMAIAFGQNDLANCASPGLAILKLVDVQKSGGTLADFHAASIPLWALFGCGVLLVFGMTTKGAMRVTQAEVRMGSQGDHVKLWAPQWCIRFASRLLRNRESTAPSLAPIATKTDEGKTMHYDPLRACVIMSVSASVIATASGLGLPVSTTYVAFAAVVATGMADRIFVRGDSALKLGRAIWVVFSWFAAAGMAAIASGIVCRSVFHFGLWGIGVTLLANLLLRRILGRRADAQEERVRRETEERMFPDDFATEEE